MLHTQHCNTSHSDCLRSFGIWSAYKDWAILSGTLNNFKADREFHRWANSRFIDLKGQRWGREPFPWFLLLVWSVANRILRLANLTFLLVTTAAPADSFHCQLESGRWCRSLTPIQRKPTAVACLGDRNWQPLTEMYPLCPTPWIEWTPSSVANKWLTSALDCGTVVSLGSQYKKKYKKYVSTPTFFFFKNQILIEQFSRL